METLWYAEMSWWNRWIRVTEGWKTRDDCEWDVASWKHNNQHYADNFRYGFERVQTEAERSAETAEYTD